MTYNQTELTTTESSEADFFKSKQQLYDCRNIEKLQLTIDALYKLLDDIDTIDDAAQDNDDLYRRLVHKVQSKKAEHIISDGFTLFFNNSSTLTNK